MKPLPLLLGAIVLIMLLAAVLVGLNDFRTDDQTDAFNVTTTSDNFGDVTLSQELFGDDTINASVTSNYSGDAPIVSTWTDATNVLRITGLTTSTQRRLTVVYKVDALTDFYGIGTIVRIFPALLVVGIIGLIVSSIVVATRRE